MAGNNVLDRIREDLDSFVGKPVKLRANQGRKKILEAEGVLEQTYPRVFVVRIDEDPRSVKRVSYTYADVLTSTVEVRVKNKGMETRIGCAGS
ncbi:MAG TPA: Veg family protein [Bacillota bacterium]|nr:Veg protein [Bacillota bacterium]HOB42154.1 Veg family protein [Bacillota bacterium]HOO29924.1 Veg family protein [Bacillota bacterium]HPQ02978.1 Veg family protein [Bacillota bacterium]HPZ13292.1 Veg family protein [Bacillota bacterium]